MLDVCEFLFLLLWGSLMIRFDIISLYYFLTI